MMRLLMLIVAGWALMMAGDDPAPRSTEGTAASQPSVQPDVPAQPANKSEPAEVTSQTEQPPTAEARRQAEDNRAGAFAKTPCALFLDTFNRPDANEISASPVGQGGLLAPLEFAEAADGEDPSQSRIDGGKLILGNNSAVTPGSHVVVKHNIIYAELVEFAGFSVSLRVEDIAGGPESPDDPDSCWMGFGVGLSEAALTGAEENYVQKNADFFLALTKADNLRVFQRGNAIGECISLKNLPDQPGETTIRAEFMLNSFAAGVKVDYLLLANGVVIGTGSFRWSKERQNYVGVDAASGGVADMLLVALPEVARKCVYGPGWLDDIPNRKASTSFLARVLEMLDSVDEIDPKGEMHEKLTDAQKREVRNTLLEIDFDMQRLLRGDPTIAERDPKKKRPSSKQEALQERTLVRPGPQPPLARTPGIVLKQSTGPAAVASPPTPQAQSIGNSGAARTGKQNKHGTVIHKGRSTRGQSGPRPRSPRVIEK